MDDKLKKSLEERISELEEKRRFYRSRAASLDNQMKIISAMEHSEKVTEFIRKSRQAEMFSLLISEVGERYELEHNFNAARDNELSQRFGLNDMESANRFIENTERDYDAEMSNLDDIIDESTYNSLFEYSEVKDGIRIDSYKLDNSEAVVPDVIDGKCVIEIGRAAFKNRKMLRSVIIPNTIKKVGSHAFALSSLVSINLPESICEIGERAFENSNIQVIRIPDNVKKISPSVFSDCRMLTRVILPKSLTEIGNSAFSCCDSLTKLDLPESVVKIGDCAFCIPSIIQKSSKKIKNNGTNDMKYFHIRIGANVNYIGNKAFDKGNGWDIIFYCKKASYAMRYAQKFEYRVRAYEDYDKLI